MIPPVRIATVGQPGPEMIELDGNAMEIGTEKIAESLALLLAESHDLPVSRDGALLSVTGTGVRITVDTPKSFMDGRTVQVPIGVNHPSWGEIFAWDQAVGVGADDRHPIAEAVDGWLHNVFPVFAAALLPSSDLAERATAIPITSGDRTSDVYYGPLKIWNFGGLADSVAAAGADRPPTMVLVEELFGGYALPDRPIWLSTFCARMANGPVTEVTLLNGDSSGDFPHIADHLPWEGHGGLKSWALVMPRDEHR
jgi:hypothetical protein